MLSQGPLHFCQLLTKPFISVGNSGFNKYFLWWLRSRHSSFPQSKWHEVTNGIHWLLSPQVSLQVWPIPEKPKTDLQNPKSFEAFLMGRQYVGFCSCQLTCITSIPLRSKVIYEGFGWKESTSRRCLLS